MPFVVSGKAGRYHGRVPQSRETQSSLRGQFHYFARKKHQIRQLKATHPEDGQSSNRASEEASRVPLPLCEEQLGHLRNLLVLCSVSTARCFFTSSCNFVPPSMNLREPFWRASPEHQSPSQRYRETSDDLCLWPNQSSQLTLESDVFPPCPRWEMMLQKAVISWTSLRQMGRSSDTEMKRIKEDLPKRIHEDLQISSKIFNLFGCVFHKFARLWCQRLHLFMSPQGQRRCCR